MSVVKCIHNHYYDDEKFDECPHCLRLSQDETSDEKKTVAVSESIDVTQSLQNLMGNYSEEKTVGLYTKKGFSPVVGWLVCTDGKECGRDYRIHVGRNFVGRSRDMDIVISDDLSLSREKHFSVAYEPKGGSFTLIAGYGDTYLNGQHVLEPTTLHEGDLIEAGSTKLVFVPYCTNERKW